MFISGSAQKSHISFGTGTGRRTAAGTGNCEYSLVFLQRCSDPVRLSVLPPVAFSTTSPLVGLLREPLRQPAAPPLAFRKGASRCLYKPGMGRGGGVSSPTALTPVFILRLRKMAKVNRSRLVYFRANSESLLNLPNKMNFKIFIFSFHSSRK